MEISKKMIIQVGFNKCGTTFIQKFFEEIDSIFMIQGALYKEMNNIIDYICFEEEVTYDPIYAKNNFYGLINSIIESRSKKIQKVSNFSPIKKEKKNYEIIYFQHESLTFRYSKSFSRSQMSSRLKEIAPETLIVCGKRDNNKWLKSHYNQYIRSGGRLGWNEFKEVRKLRKYDDIYMSNFELLGKILKANFGDRLYIYDMEDLKNQTVKILTEIIQISGIEASKTLDQIKTLNFNKKINLSDSNFATFIKRYLNYLVNYDSGSSPYQTFKGDIIKSRGSLYYYHEFKYFYRRLLNFFIK